MSLIKKISVISVLVVSVISTPLTVYVTEWEQVGGYLAEGQKSVFQLVPTILRMDMVY